MKVPPLLTAAAVLFWGRQTGLLIPAFLIAALLEGARLSPWRLGLSRENQYRAADISAALFAVTGVILYLTREPLAAVMLMFQWFPLFLVPLAAAQAWSAAGRLDAGAFFWTLRRADAAHGPRWTVDAGYSFIALCVLCAGNANVRTGEYYAANVVIIGWALWAARPGHSRAALWVLLLAAAAVLGHAGHRRLNSLQAVVEGKASGLVYGFMRAGQKDPFRSSTAIGSIGEMKRFGHIALRVRTEGGKPPPPLLRNACYDVYKAGNWFAGNAGFSPAYGDGAGGWTLSPSSASERLSLALPLPGGDGVLPLPAGAAGIEGLPAETVSLNRFGAVRAEGGPRAAVLSVRFGRKAPLDSLPGAADLAVPKEQAALIKDIAARLDLKGRPPRERAAAVVRYFAAGFTYSLSQDGKREFKDPLQDFLLRTRAGHCEYFASAAVLLLRQAGVPARYATGYSVHEYSPLEKAYVVRQRHSHAWARAHIDGAWRDFDATPAGWAAAEEPGSEPYQRLEDFGGWLKFRVMRLFSNGPDEGLRRWLAWLLLPAGLWLAWKFRKGLGKLALGRLRGGKTDEGTVPGQDSELYRVERRLRRKGLGRRPWEPFTAWARRVGPSLKDGSAADRLNALAALHDRYRFDPAGLSPKEREALKSSAETLLGLATK